MADLDLAALRQMAEDRRPSTGFEPKTVLALLDRIADLEMDLKYARFEDIMSMENEIVRLQHRAEDLDRERQHYANHVIGKRAQQIADKTCGCYDGKGDYNPGGYPNLKKASHG